MNWSQWLVIGLLTIYAVSFPPVLVKAILRKDWQRLFEDVPMTIVFVNITMELLLPQMPLNHLWFVRGLLIVASVLFLGNGFGFSRWLFSRGRSSAT